MLTQQFLLEPGTEDEPESPILLQVEIVRARKLGHGPQSVDMLQKVLEDSEMEGSDEMQEDKAMEQ